MPNTARLTFNEIPDGRIRFPFYYPNVDLLLHGVMGTDWTEAFNGPVPPQ
jgi:hypothetical protein